MAEFINKLERPREGIGMAKKLDNGMAGGGGDIEIITDKRFEQLEQS